MYEDIEQKKLFKSFKIKNLDFVLTGMNVNSMEDQFELLKMVTLNESNHTRDIYVIGFIQYQLPKWRKMLQVQEKIVFHDRAFQIIRHRKGNYYNMIF